MLPLRMLGAAMRVVNSWYWSAKFGQRTRIGKNFYLKNASNITCERGVSIDDNVRIVSETVAGYLTIKENVILGRGVSIDITGGLEIGENTLLSAEVIILTHTHPGDPHSPPRSTRKAIGRDVWIGMRAVILDKATKIGDGAHIGAGSIVTRDVAAYSVVAGNPARVIGWRASANESCIQSGSEE